MDNAQDLELIERYLSGGLTPEMKNEFEKRMTEDLDFREHVEVVSQLILGIEGYAFKEMLKKIHKREFGNNESV